MNHKITIALAGNPNAGKTTVFNAITGARQHIANYPGVTVEKKVGRVTHKGNKITVVDLPGTYSLTAYSLEEIVARDFLIKERPDLVVDIVDASNLDRNLYLAVQFRELGIPFILALNMVDLASNRGIIVNDRVLSELLEVPVVPMVARSGKGIDSLLDTIISVAGEFPAWRSLPISYGSDLDQSIGEVRDLIKESPAFDKKYPSTWLALKCLEQDTKVMGRLRKDPEIYQQVQSVYKKTLKHTFTTLEEEPEGIIADHRYGFIAGITKKAVKRKIELRYNFSDRIDKFLTNRILGPAIMMVILYVVFAFTFWASEKPVLWLEYFFGWLKSMVSIIIPDGHLHSLLVSGIIDGVGGVLGFVPLIMFMFFSIAIMEDSGYMARVAYMLDRVLRWFGLHGNSVMSLLISGGISGGCAVPGVMATRTLRDPKERIATLLVVPFMNCGAKLPLFGMLIAAFFDQSKAKMLFFFTLLSWAFALLAAKIIRSTILRGPKTPFVMELPPYRVPTLKGLVIHTWERTWQYIKKAGTIILGISIILWTVMSFPGLPEKRSQFFENRKNEVRQSFLAQAQGRDFLGETGKLEILDRQFERMKRFDSTEESVAAGSVDSYLVEIAKTAVMLEQTEPVKGREENSVKIASAYLAYRQSLSRIDSLEREETLKGTIAGRLGSFLEHLTRPIGFDYRTNIALIGGFAAKEVIVSTLGTAYSLGEVDPEEGRALSEKLAQNPHWNPLVAFTLILFTMLYVPCFATVVVLRKESSWKWVGFSISFNLIISYLVAMGVYQIGLLLRVGI